MGWKEEREAWRKKNLGLDEKDEKSDPESQTSALLPPSPDPPSSVKSEEAQKPAEEKRKPTAPWREQASPWKRDALRLVKKRPNFRARWVDPRNFERNLEDGWTFAKREDYGGVYDKIAGEEKQMDSRIRRRGMILMEIPEELARQRDDYYAKRADLAEKSIKERHGKDAQEAGVKTYDPVNMTL